MKRQNWYCVVNVETTVVAVYGSALSVEAVEKARELSKVGVVALRLVATSRHPRVGETLKLRSLSIAFEES